MWLLSTCPVTRRARRVWGWDGGVAPGPPAGGAAGDARVDPGEVRVRAAVAEAGDAHQVVEEQLVGHRVLVVQARERAAAVALTGVGRAAVVVVASGAQHGGGD